MKTKQLKQIFKATALALCLSSAMTTFAVAQPKDEVVAVVDNSAILRSDLTQSVAEISHQLQNKTSLFHRNLILNNKHLNS